MPFGLELAKAAAGQATGSIIGEGIGLLLAGPKRKAQMKTATQMQDLQIKGMKEMTDYNTQKQLEMWESTGYGAQVDQMKRAGINPALLYGMGSGGGQTSNINTGTAQGQQAHEPQATKGYEGMGLMLGQMGLMKAQERNLEADTKKKLAEAAKTSGVDTENILAQTGLTRVQTEIAQVAASVSRQTINEQMKAWENIVEKGTAEIANLKVDTDKKNQEIQNLKSEVALNAIKGALMKAQEANTNQDTKNKIQEILESEARIKTMAEQLMIAWDSLSNQTTQTRINWDRHLDGNEWDEIKSMIPTFLLPIGKGFGTGGQPIKGFHKR